MTMTQFFAYMLGGGGVGLLVSRLFTWLDEYWLAFKQLRPDLKRGAVFAGTFIIASGIGALVIAAQVWFGDAAMPATAQEWAGQLFIIGSAAIEFGQVSHKIAQVKTAEAARRKAETEARWKIVMGE